MLPSWSAPAAAVAAVLSYIAWTAAAASSAPGLLTLVTAVLFWLSTMVLAAALVQRAVGRYRDRDGP